MHARTQVVPDQVGAGRVSEQVAHERQLDARWRHRERQQRKRH
jgi:hypothetical protein